MRQIFPNYIILFLLPMFLVTSAQSMWPDETRDNKENENLFSQTISLGDWDSPPSGKSFKEGFKSGKHVVFILPAQVGTVDSENFDCLFMEQKEFDQLDSISKQDIIYYCQLFYKYKKQKNTKLFNKFNKKATCCSKFQAISPMFSRVKNLAQRSKALYYILLCGVDIEDILYLARPIHAACQTPSFKKYEEHVYWDKIWQEFPEIKNNLGLPKSTCWKIFRYEGESWLSIAIPEVFFASIPIMINGIVYIVTDQIYWPLVLAETMATTVLGIPVAKMCSDSWYQWAWKEN